MIVFSAISSRNNTYLPTNHRSICQAYSVIIHKIVVDQNECSTKGESIDSTSAKCDVLVRHLQLQLSIILFLSSICTHIRCTKFIIRFDPSRQMVSYNVCLMMVTSSGRVKCLSTVKDLSTYMYTRASKRTCPATHHLLPLVISRFSCQTALLPKLEVMNWYLLHSTFVPSGKNATHSLKSAFTETNVVAEMNSTCEKTQASSLH